MADLAQMLSQIMSSEEGRQQVNQVLSMLGQSGPEAAQAPPPPPSGNGGFDLNSLTALLNQGSSGGNPDSAGPGLGGLASMLNQGSSGGNTNGNSNSGGFDLSGLMAMLNQGGAAGSGNSGLPSLDINKLLQVQRLLSQNANDPNANLLRALKPHLSPENGKKVDEAVRLIQILNLLPLLKESGLFGSLLGGENG